MKVNGQKVNVLEPEVLVIPKGDAEYVFKAQPVLNSDSFEEQFPKPILPTVVVDGEDMPDPNNKKFRENLIKWASAKSHWLFIQSLSATDGLEWDTVDLADPSTFGNYFKDLENNGFSDYEISRILGLVTVACGLSSERIDLATKDFLARAEQDLEKSTSKEDQPPS